MGSIHSSVTNSKLSVAPRVSEEPPNTTDVNRGKGDTGLVIQLKFFDRNYPEKEKLRGDEMKRAAGRTDRDFIGDLQNDRFVDRELSSEIFQEYVQKAVEARLEFNRNLEEAGIQNPMADIAKVRKVPECEVVSAESELNQWLTESETSENLLSTSDTNEATAGVYPETIHSA